MRNSRDLGKVVANHINAQHFKDQVMAPQEKRAKAKNHATKPTCITEQGTMFRIINTCLCEEGRPSYIETRNAHDRDDTDTRLPNAVEYGKLNKLYHPGEKSIGELSEGGASLIGHNVSLQICQTYDKLTDDEFKQVADYMHAKYRKARNDKNQSGQHESFNNYCGGISWLVYLHAVLERIGDKDLMNCAYAELPEGIARTSTDKFQPIRRRDRRHRRSRNTPDSPQDDNNNNMRTKKHAAAEAAEDAAQACEDKQDCLIENLAFDRILEMKGRTLTLEEQMIKLKGKYKKAKRDLKEGRIDKYDLKAIKVKRDHMKQIHASFQIEYERLKKETGYKSPVVSSASSCSGSSNSELSAINKRAAGKKLV